MNKGLFITFEGGEGAGKSTVLDRIFEALVAQGHDVVKTREPGGSLLGEKIRSIILHQDKVGLRAEVLLFLAARAQHVEELIAPALRSGKIVLCDRFHDSTIAYQGFGRALGRRQVEELCLFATNGLKPDLSLLFDIDPLMGLRRRSKASRGNLDSIEKEDLSFHHRVRDGFLTIARHDTARVKCIDASRDRGVVFEDAWGYVQEAILILGTE